MPLTGLSDEELMARYQLGSEEAFSALYDRHAGKVLGFVRKRISDPEHAAEVYQEVFVKLHKSKHLYNQALPYLPWLFSVTRSVVIDALRVQLRPNEGLAVADPDKFSPPGAEEPQTLDLQPHLAGLPLKQREAVEMRYVSDKTFEEIALVLKTSPVNARQLISRGIKRLRELVLEGDSDDRAKK